MEHPSLSREGGEGRVPYIRRATPRMSAPIRPVATEHVMPVPEAVHTPDWKQIVAGLAMASATSAEQELAPTPSLEDRARAYLGPTLGSTEALSARDVIDLYRQETGYVLSGPELEEYLVASVTEAEGVQPITQPVVDLAAIAAEAPEVV